MEYKTALVTGGAGFIGSHIVEELLKDGLRVVVYDNFSMGKEENLPKSNRLKIVKGDILDLNKLNDAMKGIDIVFHEAAKVTIRNSVSNFLEDAETNILGTLNVIKCIVNNKVKKMVYASSMAVYGEKNSPLEETDVPNPMSPYGISKHASERYCMNASKDFGFECICLRYFNTYGQRQTLTPYVGVITIFINKILNKESPIIFGDGNQVRDFIYVKDVVQANLLAMNKSVNGEVFNIGTGKGTTVNEIADILRNKINPGIEIKYEPARLEELKYSVADISKAKKMLGFEPKGFIEEKIDDVIEYNKMTYRAGKI